jgi:hypothetical protein
MVQEASACRRVHLMRQVLVVVATIGLVAVFAPAVGATQVTHTYQVQVRGDVRTDPGQFAREAAAVLGDARGWTLGGSVAIDRVASGGDFNLILASPAVVEAAAPVCSARYSCRVGDNVYINDRNWRATTPAWQRAGGDVPTYREYLVNHEVGHYLGFGHVDCPGGGQDAPVMQQQSIALNGCEPNGHPLDFERERLASRLGVPIYDDWVFTDVPRGVAHQEAIDRIAETGIAGGYQDGTFRPRVEITRAQMASFLQRTFDLDNEGPPDYPDVDPDDVHADAIAAIDEAGIAGGFPDGTFRPDAAVNRGQMARFLASGFGYEADGAPPYDDVPETHVHADAITAVAEAGVARGFGDGTFRPGDPLTRGQMASFLDRSLHGSG